MKNDRIKTALVSLVGAGWAFNLVAPAVIHSYHSNLAANAPLMLILGAYFTTKIKDKTGDE